MMHLSEIHLLVVRDLIGFANTVGVLCLPVAAKLTIRKCGRPGWSAQRVPSLAVQPSCARGFSDNAHSPRTADTRIRRNVQDESAQFARVKFQCGAQIVQRPQQKRMNNVTRRFTQPNQTGDPSIISAVRMARSEYRRFATSQSPTLGPGIQGSNAQSTSRRAQAE